jgi:hypothetical protein
MFVPSAAAQYDPDCWLEQMKKAEALKVLNPALYDEARRRGEETIKRGQVLNKELGEAKDEAHKAIHAELERTQAYQRERQTLEERGRGLNHRDPREVRRYQRDHAQFLTRFHTHAEARAVAQPKVDEKHAAPVVLQRESNEREAAFHRRRLAAGANREQQWRAFDEALKTASRELQLPREVRSKLNENRALREAAAAAAIGLAVAKTGTIPDSLEALAGGAEAVAGGSSTLFDGTRKVAIDLSARSLEGSMGLSQIGSRWGGSADVVDVRANIGPRTREAVSALGATALLKNDQALQGQRIIRSAIQKVQPPPPEPAAGQQGDQRMKDYLRKVAEATKAAADEVTKVVQGPPIVLQRNAK